MLPDKLVMAGIVVLFLVTDYNILAPFYLPQTNLWSRKFLVKKLLVKKNLVLEKSLVLKNFGPKNFFLPNVVYNIVIYKVLDLWHSRLELFRFG